MTTYKDFWEFYTANQKKATSIIEINTWKYSKAVGLRDLRQEILLRIARSDFMEQWDPSKSSLLTYFANKVRGYAAHIFDAMTYKPVYTTKLTDASDITGTSRKGYPVRRKYYPELNGGVDGRHTLEDPQTPEDSAIAADILGMAQKSEKRVIAYYVSGYSATGISQILKLSRSIVNHLIASYKTRVAKEFGITMEEPEYAEVE